MSIKVETYTRISVSKFFIIIACWAALFVTSAYAQKKAKKTMYNSYRGLVMAGYQGWFNTPGDGADLQWRHYTGKNGFKPGSCSIDFWPEVSEYTKLYPTDFEFEDGSKAQVFSSHDASTVDVHFRWMKEYGLDGVFMQRFVADIRHPKIKNHFDTVLQNAMISALKYERAISIMYDLSGIRKQDVELVLTDIDTLSRQYSLFKHTHNPSYLYHNGKPLITVWGVGFNDGRHYGLDEIEYLVSQLKKRGFSIMLGVPAFWRELRNDAINDVRLHTLIKRCDIIMPWLVARFNESRYPYFKELIKQDIQWTNANKVDYAPLCFPGFSWGNMKDNNAYIPRNEGKFFKKQLDGAIESGAQMLYIAMFDEMDEGTAIFKCATRVPKPVPGSIFVSIETSTGSDYYLRLVGEARKQLQEKLK